jgi:DNA polymerase type B, organellar and viral
MIPPHIMQRPNGIHYPRAVACISIRSALEDDPRDPRRYLERLLSWHAVGWSGRDGRPNKLWEAQGVDVPSLWGALARAARAGSPLWIVSRRAVTDVSLLGLWRMCTAGAAALGGLVVLGNPPTIIRTMRPVSAWWLDLGNWTPWQPPPDMPHRERVLELARFMVGMIDTLQVEGLGGLKMSAGAQALHTFKHAFLRHSIVCHTHPVAHNLEREAYYGGRCEPMLLGHVPGQAYEYDIRSAYASVCVGADVPCLLESVHRAPTLTQLGYLMSRYLVCAEVEIETDEPAYPMRHSGRVLWPVGAFRTTLHHPELSDALAMHRIRAVHRCCCYGGFPALDTWACSVFALRQQSPALQVPSLSGWVKGLLVALPGALGRSHRGWRDWPEAPCRGEWDQRVVMGPDGVHHSIRSIAGRRQIEYHDGWAWESVPAIAGWVTSAARMRLLSEIRKAGWDHVHYADTDSLIVDATGRLALGSGDSPAAQELGGLRHVATHADLWIGGAKHLYRSGKMTMGGVRQTSEHGGPSPHDYYVPIAASDYLSRRGIPEPGVIVRPAHRISGFPGRRLTPDGRLQPRRICDGEET